MQPTTSFGNGLANTQSLVDYTHKRMAMSGTGFRKEMIQEPREFLTSNLVKDYLPSRGEDYYQNVNKCGSKIEVQTKLKWNGR
jgi:hypothetical protein